VNPGQASEPGAPVKTPIALIGFGEAGGMLAAGLIGCGHYSVAVYDILLDADNSTGQGSAADMRRKAERIGARLCGSAAEAAQGAALVVSAVTAAAAADVAAAAGDYLRAGQILLDINSIAPHSKRRNAELVEVHGAAYVEAAVMAPVFPAAMKVPMLLGGEQAPAVVALLGAGGVNLKVVGSRIGEASAIKMCRSIMIKGMEALTVECLLTARCYGVEDQIIASVDKSYPGLGFPALSGYFIERVVQHGRRRAAEMRESAQTVARTGLAPTMALAIAERQDSIADIVAARPELRGLEETAWREALDLLADALGLDRGERLDGDG
jgi:3-hydroxyisobutyrate dehydrogenase-like beta-hydroxyacid dehydrogenase